jgi:hypothetical protein
MPVSWTDGAFLDEDGNKLSQPPRDWGLTAMFRDLNGDGFPDLYVCNDYWTPDRIWLNDGRGHFRAIDRLAPQHERQFDGSGFCDVDRDGAWTFCVDMLSRDHRLRRANAGSKPDRFAQLIWSRAEYCLQLGSQISPDYRPRWSCSPVFLDVDLDGCEDLSITTTPRMCKT